MSVPYRITVRISEQVMQKLEDMVENFQYESVSDIIRLAISEFIEKNEGKGGTSKVDLVLPKKILEELEKDVDTGGAISLEDLIRLVLRDYTLKKVNKEIDEISGKS
ncbi:MAG: ribbon-helix-helix domain-containing protein [Candidatus Thermoplasmatota archaeon]|jgi:CopG family nickel-responsive transcriptional regulator|nr:ribbon-helix-helix domain-containing protein [Candidatus Thermoplasmatota archaeon]MCL5668132.1 ribbon-helix-helix domain-containing protein [Candidatus Thermoplasmatota archaeon]MCL5679178.1 ribbon-helix-helix domain-containing protein [Candidatus Thermoplasmatota archaeon]